MNKVDGKMDIMSIIQVIAMGGKGVEESQEF